MQETWVQSLGWEEPLEEEVATTPVFLPGKPMDTGAWRAIVCGVAKDSDMTEGLSSNDNPTFYSSMHWLVDIWVVFSTFGLFKTARNISVRVFA